MSLERISVQPEICHGKACIKGTRVPVHLILEMMAAGETIEGVLAAYPFLTQEDIAAALEYGAELAKEEIARVPGEAA
jgi:uncharacterized protein (DUF433 family)